MKKIATLSAALILTATTVAQAQTKAITYLTPQTETQGYTKTLLDLSADYTKQHAGVKVQYQNAPQTDLSQKIQLLAASNSLPTLFGIDTPTLTDQLATKGQLVDLEATFKRLGIYNQLNPAAVALHKKINGGKFVTLPLEMNIEGFWYNKALFKKYGVAEPRTWDALVKAADTFAKNGIQPFAASGEQKWPLTRLLNGYVARKYGPDVMDRVKAGTLQVTDAGFVEAARAIQDLGKKGYFGKGVTTIDYTTAMNTFLEGKAAMFYMGSWALGNYNDPKQNKIGAQNIGLFNFPTVPGGRGTLSDWSVNTGLVVAINKTQDDAALDDWMKYVFTNFGNRAFADQGLITGFKVTKKPATTPALTSMVSTRLNTVKNPYLWFEANLSPKASSVATDNVQLLVTGDITPEDYMAQLQAALK